MSKTPLPEFYFVCDDGAKFFHTEATAICPRCGRTVNAVDKLVPPWKQLMKVGELAARLNVSVSKAYELCAHDIEVHKIGGSLRISEAALAAYLERTRLEREEPKSRKPNPPRPRLRHITLR